MEPSEGLNWKERIRRLALDSGFLAIGFTKSEPIAGLEEFMAERHALGYNTPFEKSEFLQRVDPKAIWPACETVVTLAYPLPFTKSPREGEGVLARSAVGQDYHRVVKKALEKLITSMEESGWMGEKPHIQVDTGSLNERAFALRAGMGWIGKNQQLIIPKVGSFVALALMLLDQELPPDEPIGNQCGECNRCLEACPPQILGQGHFQATRCLSYLTQSKDPLTEAQATLLGNRIFGCDTCQEACPHNQPWLKRELDEGKEKGRKSLSMEVGTGEEGMVRENDLTRGVDLWKTLNLTKAPFNQEWKSTAAGWRGKGILQRNSYVALRNLQDPRLEEWDRGRKSDKPWVIKDFGL